MDFEEEGETSKESRKQPSFIWRCVRYANLLLEDIEGFGSRGRQQGAVVHYGQLRRGTSVEKASHR
jgi:hypothetical protein